MSGFSEEKFVELQRDVGQFFVLVQLALLLRFPAAYSVLYDYLKSVIPDIESFENVPRGEKGKQLLVKFEHEAFKAIALG